MNADDPSQAASTAPLARRSVPWTLRSAGILGGLVAVLVAVQTLREPPVDGGRAGARWAFVALLAVAALGTFRGTRWGYWVAVPLFGFLALAVGGDAFAEKDASSIIAALAFVVPLGLLLLPQSTRHMRKPREPEGARRSRRSQPEVAEGHVMHPRTRRWLIVASTVFGSIGTLMMLFGEGSDRALGMMVFLFFGVGIVPVVLMTRPLQREAPIATELVERRGTFSQGLVFEYSRTKLRLATVSLASFSAGALVMAWQADNFESSRYSPTWVRAVGLITAAILGAAAVAGAVNSGRRMFLALLPQGLYLKGRWGSTFVPWDAVTDAGLLSLQGTPMLGIALRDFGAVEMGFLARLTAGINRALLRAWVAADLTWPTNSLNVFPATLARAVRFYLENPEERVNIGRDGRAGSFTTAAVAPLNRP